MTIETNKINGSKKSGGSGGGLGGFRAKLDHYLYSGEKKHVIAGIAIIGVLFGVPWYFMNKGMIFLLPFLFYNSTSLLSLLILRILLGDN